MNKMMIRTCGTWAALVALLTCDSTSGREPFDVTLANPSFDQGVDRSGIPLGWSKYGGRGKDQHLRIVDGPDGGKALLIADGDPTAELGVVQTFALKGGETYRATVKVRAVEGASAAGAHLQFRFLPSNQYAQTWLAAASDRRFSQVSVTATAPPDTTKGVIYLYSHRDPTPKVLVTDVGVVGGLPPPPPPPPAPIPPQYTQLKNQCLDIPLVQDGRPGAVIVAPASGAYQAAAAEIQKAIAGRTGVKVLIVPDNAPQAALPCREHLIVLGNRSTNKTMNALYDLYYCLVDLKYPGPEGYVLRSVHNPLGNGKSVIIVGGSDAAGVAAGARELATMLTRSPAAKGRLSIGWTMATRLGKGVRVPTDIREFETWEASKGYGSSGYFGWCSISKRMAMYYMTGDELSAREVIRLAFPDKRAIKDMEEIDGERIENKHDPLAGFYHYNAHMAILFWDLIEESPVFTDEERLKVTNAFARQLNHRKNEGVYGLTRAPAYVGSRHGQWSAISLYCLGRYFNKHYPDPVWAQCVRGGELAFQSLHEHAWIAGENDNLFWNCTGIAPVFTYLTLTGDRKPLANGVVAQLLRGQEILISGRVPDWALSSASMDLFHKAAYVTGDGRWITYRERTGVDTNVFRLGQSFWPDPALEAKLPTDLVGKWSIHRLPEPAWGERGSGLPFEQSFYFGSYRSAADSSGDYVLLDGFNGASRNPYHTFDILELRINGQTILQGYHNQVATSADGMVQPAVAMDAALLHADVVGASAMATGRVPRAAFCDWQRTLALRTGRYAIVIDDLTFRADSQNMKVSTTWQIPGGRWDAKSQAVRIPARFELRSCDVQDSSGAGVITMNWNGTVKQGQHRIAFYLIGASRPGSSGSLACMRLADNAAVMALPQAALAVAGEYRQTKGKWALLAEDHLAGHAVTIAGIEDPLMASDVPVDIDWDLAAGVVQVVAEKPAVLRLRLAASDGLRLDGVAVNAVRANDMCSLAMAAGRHTVTGAAPAAGAMSRQISALQRLLAEARTRQANGLATPAAQAKATARALSASATFQAGAGVTQLIPVTLADGSQLALAAENKIHLLSPEGKEIRSLETEGKIRVLHWWADRRLLLAGCVDEKVVAFDAAGRRQWTFTSEMDPAVYEAAKTYWFKSAPGHEGIHGLYSGTFDQGKSRCFVGSACTLEILDETGNLVKRTPVFWGPGWKFLLVPGPNDSRNLLVARWPNGTDNLAIVNSRTMTNTGRGYDGVPTGHSHVGGWTAQNRTALRQEDLEGDGKKELVTAINGIWNRVTVYSEQGQPLANAQFGPGARTAPRAQMRDLDVADLDGDGRKEIVVGISEGLVVALTNRCEKRWSARLPSPPLSVRCVRASGAAHPCVVVGCDDGAVTVLDHKGTPLQLGKVTGRPLHMVALDTPAAMVVVATDRGEVTWFRVEH